MFCVLYRLVRAEFSSAIYNFANVSKIPGKNINFTVLFLLLCLMNLCFRISELPNLLPITEVCETLLHLPNGTLLMNRLVANVADSFHEGIYLS